MSKGRKDYTTTYKDCQEGTTPGPLWLRGCCSFFLHLQCEIAVDHFHKNVFDALYDSDPDLSFAVLFLRSLFVVFHSALFLTSLFSSAFPGFPRTA